jgi:hypothetical protein
VADRFGRVIVVWPTTPISGDGGGLDWSLRGTAGGFSAPRSLKATIRDSGAASASPKLAMQLTTEQPAGSRS